jgi:hypothetical protein
MKANLCRRAAAVGLSVAAVLALSFLTATPAAAIPLNCDAALWSNGVGSAWCSNGTGQVRVAVGCEWWGWWQTVYGPWVNINASDGASRAGCPSGWGARWAGVGGRR